MEQFDNFEENNNFEITKNQSKNYNSLVFAYIGDAVFSLFVRSYFASKSNSKAGVLNTKVNKFVRASSQSKAFLFLEEMLTEEEMQIAKSARNIKTNNVAKNSNLEEYKRATMFEALLGYLYMTNCSERLNKLLNLSLQFMEQNI